MKQYFTDNLRRSLLSAPVKDKKLLLMLSGGADSMVLLHFLMELREELGFELAAFSLDHMFRGESSLEDLNFVKKEAEKRGLRLHAYRRDVAGRARELGIGDELCARLTRYNLAAALKLCYNYDYIISAHHKSDTVESIFLHFIRGSGLSGLRGIKAVDGAILRPLLFASKAEILRAAEDFSIPYREDETNSENRYSRNYLRNEILPRLEKLNPNLENSLMRTAALLSDEDDFMEEMAEAKIRELSKEGSGPPINSPNTPSVLALDLEMMKSCHLALKRRILIKLLRRELGKVDIYSSVVEELIKLIQAPVGKRLEFRGLVFEIERKVLSIRREKPREEFKERELSYGKAELATLTLDCQRARLRDGRIFVDDKVFDGSGEDKLLDYLVLPEELFEQGLILRQRAPEDSIRPAGRKGSSRKIKKLLNDYKVPISKRKELLYLASPFEVLWILGIEKTYLHSEILSHREQSKNIVLIRAYALCN